MSNAPPDLTGPRRSLGARATAQRLVRRIIAGSLRLKDLRESEKRETLLCLDQTAEMLDRLSPISREVEKLLADYEKAPRT